MNRTGLAITLVIGAAVGIVFGFYPQLDIVIAGWFYDSATHSFIGRNETIVQVRDAATYLIAALVAPAVLAILGKLVAPKRRMLIPGRAALFLTVSLALGPFLIANVGLKNVWGRMRPIDIVQFAGTDRFTPWWDPRGPCAENCSFVGGEAASAFWTLAPAALTPPQWRPLAYGAAIVFGSGIGVLRMAGGGHFFTDIVFAGVFMFLVVWALYRSIYRWRGTRLTDEDVESPLERAGKAMREMLAGWARRVGGRKDQRF
jgi:membrane-associated PAP2 superfamily phosphatase